MKEKIKNICKRVYDGYQRLVAKVGADRLVHLFLSVAAVSCLCGASCVGSGTD